MPGAGGARQGAYVDDTPNPQSWFDPYENWKGSMTQPGYKRDHNPVGLKTGAVRPMLQNIFDSIGLSAMTNRRSDIQYVAVHSDPRLAQNRK